ncbi:MAG: FAD:protein FMN transferase [Planctomycetota bacterium]
MSVAAPKARGWLLALGLLAFAGAMLAPFVWVSRQVAQRQVVRLTGETMGTAYSVTLVGGSSADALQIRIAERLAELNRRLSTYDPESELSQFNAAVTDAWVLVSPETARVVSYALQVAAESAGRFDPTVGPVVNLWGFGPDGSRSEPPAPAELDEALQRVGHELVAARTDQEPALRKGEPSVYLDLSAVAKGYGVDAIAEVVELFGYSDYLVEIGGEVVGRGTKLGQPWRVGVERADAPVADLNGQRLQTVVELRDRALATSGDYRNFFEHDGERYSHTIDPLTGRPVDHDLATVTVLAETCMQADALATALLVLGPVAGYDWAVERDIAALFVSRSDADDLARKATPAWIAAAPEASLP